MPPSTNGFPRTIRVGDTRAKLVKTPRQIGSPISVDVNGDGVVDRAQLFGGWRTTWGSWVDWLRVRTGGGGSRGVGVFDEDGNYRYPTVQMLGHDDVNGDGSVELLLYLGGNTSHSGAVVTWTRDRLAVANARFHNAVDGWYSASPLAFYGHDNSCPPWCDLSTRCQMVAGEPRLVTEWGEAKPSWMRLGRLPKHYTRYWHVSVYKLVGAKFVLTERHKGATPSNQTLPTEWPFINSLSCGTATWPNDS